ncbi:MAG: alpha/beta hydrolase [Spiroplasma sp.]|nr:alpha/beta hydrolase [Spiroplasma sp.]
MDFLKTYWWVIVLAVVLVLWLFFLFRWFQLLHIDYNWEKRRHFPQWSDVGIITRDNYLLHTNYNFVPDSKCIVIGIHGMACAKEDFIAVKKFLSEQNVSLLSFDQRNWGKNSKWKYHTLGTTISDLQDIISVINEKLPNQKIFLLGEALGSAFCALALKRLNSQLTGIILTNFVTKSKIIKLTPSLVFKIMLGFCFNKQLILPIKIDPKDISDNDIYIDYLNERNYRRTKQQGITVLYAMQAKKISKAVVKNINHSRIPAMIIQTGNDVFADYDKVKVNEKKWRDNVTYKFYDQGKHAILNDLTIKPILQDVVYWLITVQQKQANQELQTQLEEKAKVTNKNQQLEKSEIK